MFQISKLDPIGFGKVNALYCSIAGVLISLPGIASFLSRLSRGRSLYIESYYWIFLLAGTIFGAFLVGYLFAHIYNNHAEHHGGLRLTLEKNPQDNYYEVKKVDHFRLAGFVAIYSALTSAISFFIYCAMVFVEEWAKYGIDSEEFFIPLIIAVVGVGVMYGIGFLLAIVYNRLAERRKGFKIRAEYLPDEGGYALTRFEVGDFCLAFGILNALLYGVGIIIYGILFFLYTVVAYSELPYIMEDLLYYPGPSRLILAGLLTLFGGMILVFIIALIYGVLFAAIYNAWQTRMRFIRFWLVKID